MREKQISLELLKKRMEIIKIVVEINGIGGRKIIEIEKKFNKRQFFEMFNRISKV